MLLTPIKREVARCVASLFIYYSVYNVYNELKEDNENESYFYGHRRRIK